MWLGGLVGYMAFSELGLFSMSYSRRSTEQRWTKWKYIVDLSFIPIQNQEWGRSFIRPCRKPPRMCSPCCYPSGVLLSVPAIMWDYIVRCPPVSHGICDWIWAHQGWRLQGRVDCNSFLPWQPLSWWDRRGRGLLRIPVSYMSLLSLCSFYCHSILFIPSFFGWSGIVVLLIS